MVGDPASPAFRLEISGRGFGLGGVAYSVSEGTGTLAADELALEITRGPKAARSLELPIPRDGLTLESPRRVIARVSLEQPLAPGIYGVSLRQGGEETVALESAFEVPPAGEVRPDAGADDLGAEDLDAGFPEDGGEELDGGQGLDGAQGLDAEPGRDAEPGDSGLGDFRGPFAHRQPVEVRAAGTIPAGTTLRVFVPHLTLIGQGLVRADGADLAIYQGGDRLPHHYEDHARIGTDGLALITRLLRDVPATGAPESDPLALYFGDPLATFTPDPGVFEFHTSFDVPVTTTPSNRETVWLQADNWAHCNLNRPTEATVAQNGAYCVFDRTSSNLVRQTLATPRLNAVVSNPGPGRIYEMSFWLAGRMIDGPADILYLSHYTNNEDFALTQTFLDGGYGGFQPNASLTFRDVNNANRTVRGWRLPNDQVQWWLRSTLRFLPAFNGPSFHFRHISLNSNSYNGTSFAAVDDWWIRLTMNPEPQVGLGPMQTRGN